MTGAAGHLLDANVLIALVLAEHEHHARTEAWFLDQDAVTLCPVVEGALVRTLVRLGESARTARHVLARWRADPRLDFVADDLSYADADLGAVRGHRQVTDAYLVALAAQHGRGLATLDAALAATHPSVTLISTLDG